MPMIYDPEGDSIRFAIKGMNGLELVNYLTKSKRPFIVAERLGAMKDKSTVKPLISCLLDPNYSSLLRCVAAKALGLIGDTRAVGPLIACLDDLDNKVRRDAFIALMNIKDKGFVEPLIECLKNKKGGYEVVQALGCIGGTRAVEQLVACLKTPHVFIFRHTLNRERYCSNVAQALGEIGDARAVEALIEYLKNNRHMLSTTVEALGKIGDSAAVESLIDCLKDKASCVREAAAEALGKIGDQRALEPLAECLRRESGSVFRDVRIAATKALEKINKGVNRL